MSKELIDVEKVATLARLDISDANKAKLQKDMVGILEYVEQLQELDVEGIEPTAHAAQLRNVMRDDVSQPSFEREVMLSNAPLTVDDELVRVPQVLPSEEGA